MVTVNSDRGSVVELQLSVEYTRLPSQQANPPSV